MNSRTTLSLHTGREMPVIGLGTWELTRDTAATVEEALRLGYRMIDTAYDYGSQRGIGEALRRTEVEREKIFLVAKVEEHDDAYDALRRYLGEMDQPYADLVLIHRPPEDGVGARLWEGLARARDDSLALELGVSNYSIPQMEALIDATGEVPVVNQIEWSPFGWSETMLAWCRERDVVIQGYSPLTRGKRLDAPTLARIAAEYEATPAQLLLRWAIELAVVPLPKANQIAHLEENLGAFDFEIGSSEMTQLDQLDEEYSALGERPQYI